ncbi:MAG: hypothetical protein GY811_16340 [Myxococcales bacterium]|nr:hypothetical protein [Myxococcales bacterium]
MPVPAPIVTPAQAPYDVTIVGEDGRELDTYSQRNRFYVHGQTGERYSIRVDNPTNRRVEAVVSVDGLDVIDGKSANFRTKRGYIVPPRGSVTIDGFRTSTQSVAAFRFSSVSGSYAGRKDKARNVGVIGVALFEEKAQATLVLPSRDRELRVRKSSKRPAQSRPAPRRPAPRSASGETDLSEDMSQPCSDSAGVRSSLGGGAPMPGRSTRPQPEREERAGLGTAFGENRSSAVRFTQFQRANPRKPTSIAELRYNNGEGLRALGIRLRTFGGVDQNELAIRESASAFPDNTYQGSFAKPPQ